MDECIITTVYFDGQFWSALIEEYRGGRLYTGKYVFGPEPSNPRLLHWMLYEFIDIPLYPVGAAVCSRPEKIAARSSGSLCKSLDAFKAAQSAYLSERKTVRRQKKRVEKESRWQLKQVKRKEKRRH